MYEALLFSLLCFPSQLLRIIGQKKGAAVTRSDDAPGWRRDYKEPPSEEIKQERNHKFIKVPNLDHLIKARQDAECATKAAVLLSPRASGPAARSRILRVGEIVSWPQWWGWGCGGVGSVRRFARRRGRGKKISLFQFCLPAATVPDNVGFHPLPAGRTPPGGPPIPDW